MRSIIAEYIRAIQPYDELERQHIAATLDWIASGAPLFRIARPDHPPQHLVSYFALVDDAARKVLLVDHRRAGLWLPSGGHVEPDEDPAATVEREVLEELGTPAIFRFAAPLFLTVTQTVGSHAGHTDVSLWYVLRGDATTSLVFDAAEFYGVQWFDFDAVPFERADPHLRRFIAKLKRALTSQNC
ncbi:MAG TPA: NUDIX domain-containing protein [Herpetosiphonaceae bacterium]